MFSQVEICIPSNVLLKSGGFFVITPFVSLVVLIGLSLILNSTRKYAVLLTGLLMYMYPIHSFIVLATAGIAYYFYRRNIA